MTWHDLGLAKQNGFISILSAYTFVYLSRHMPFHYMYKYNAYLHEARSYLSRIV